MNVLQKIKKVDFPEIQYYRVAHEKKQIVLHHTVSGIGADGDISWWLSTKARVATCLIVSRNGVPNQLYSSMYWGHHLGIKRYIFAEHGLPSINTLLNQQSIAVEIDSWGGLIEVKGKWYVPRWDNKLRRMVPTKTMIKEQNVVKYPNGFRGFEGFEKYTDSQLGTVQELLRYWKVRYPKIPTKFQGMRLFDVCEDALKGKPGIFSHVSYRPDKSDCHPQKELIQILKKI